MASDRIALDMRGFILTEMTGPIDDPECDRLRQSFTSHVRSGRRRHVVDLRPLGVLDTNTLRTLIRALRAVREIGGEVRLVVTDPEMCATLAATGLDHIFPIYGTVDEAVVA